MNAMFEDALVIGYEPLTAVMTNHEGDRHVLAAAVRGRADLIITSNLRHFPHEALRPYDMDVQGPDSFLLHQFHLAPDLVLETMKEQVGENRLPPQSLPELLLRLKRHAPDFVETVHQHLHGQQAD